MPSIFARRPRESVQARAAAFGNGEPPVDAVVTVSVVVRLTPA